MNPAERAAAWLVSLALSLGACSPDDDYTPTELEPYWPTDGWRTADPRDAAMDKDALDDLVGQIRWQHPGVDNLTVVRRGYVVVDAYFGEYGRDDPHLIYSCTKSVVSTLIGIARDDDVLPGLDTGLEDLFAGRQIQNLDADKRAITLEHLLTMQAGLDARDSYLYDWEGLDLMLAAEDAVQYVLDLPMAEPPGTRFEYTNGVSHLLSALITEKTGRSALAFAEVNLFTPLGIRSVEWTADSLGNNWGYSHIHLTPHAMAKIGYLFLKEGTWDQEQVVPADWVDAATRIHTDATLRDGYGYQWWVDASGYYLALGSKGQFIFVSPAHDLVAVFTSSEPEGFEFSIPLFGERIIPAVVE